MFYLLCLSLKVAFFVLSSILSFAYFVDFLHLFYAVVFLFVVTFIQDVPGYDCSLSFIYLWKHFWDTVSYNLGWPHTCCELSFYPLACAWVLRLWVRATMLCLCGTADGVQGFVQAGQAFYKWNCLLDNFFNSPSPPPRAGNFIKYMLSSFISLIWFFYTDSNSFWVHSILAFLANWVESLTSFFLIFR